MAAAAATITCGHDHGCDAVLPQTLIIVSMVKEETVRLVYHYRDGKVLKTRYHRTSDPIEYPNCDPINCPDCKAAYYRIIGASGFCRECADHSFDELRRAVALKELASDRDVLNYRIMIRIAADAYEFDAEGLMAWVDDHRKSNGADARAVVKGLKRVEEGGSGNNCCCVCLEQLVDNGGEEEGLVMEMPCGHVFHGGCFVDWLLTSDLCPLCRFQLH